MAINWGILSNALASNPGQALQQGMEQGVTRSALGAMVQNPNDPRAMNALAAFNPEAAFAMQGRQAQQRQMTGQAEEQELENRRNNIIMGASFLEGVTDEAGFQAARQRAASAGIRLEGVPETYDPNFVNQVRQTAQSLIAAHQRRSPQGQPPSIQREVEYLRSIGRNDLAEQRLQNFGEGAPVVFDVTGDGAPDLVPRSYFRQGQPVPQGSAPPPPEGFVIDDEEGGGSSDASNPFPGDGSPVGPVRWR